MLFDEHYYGSLYKFQFIFDLEKYYSAYRAVQNFGLLCQILMWSKR